MALTPGTRIGVYEVLAAIGAGGMGQVWRARDTKLNRDVALKVLPDSFANDTDRLARFTREAQTLAALNHPHIAAIYGLDESNGVRAGDGAGRRRRPVAAPASAPRALRRGRPECLSTRCCRSQSRSPRRSKPPTSRGSSIAI